MKPVLFHFLFTLALAVNLPLAYAQAESGSIVENEAEPELEIQANLSEQSEAGGGIFGLGWLDRSQAYASTSVNSLANQLDRFFGVPVSDLEAAYSSLRLTWVNYWSDIEGYDTGIRVRGKIFLPRINERISLVFSKDEDESIDGSQVGVESESNQSTKVDLDFNVKESDTQRLDLRAGLSSSLKARLSLRYRYEFQISDTMKSRFSQAVYFKDGDGFGFRGGYQLDMNIGDNALLRWSNSLRFEERTPGARWDSGMSYFRKQSENTGVTYYIQLSGETSPGYPYRNDIGVRIRKNVARPWLFIELEPGYTWQKNGDLFQNNYINLNAEHSAFIYLRFEMAIGR